MFRNPFSDEELGSRPTRVRSALAALKPGTLARDVYGAWQKVVDDAGLPRYRRHHCGYCVGIGFPPSWTGGNTDNGLRHDSDLEIQTGMSFHILSWQMNTGRGDVFLSNCVLLGENGPEVLTRTPHVQTITSSFFLLAASPASE